MVEFINIADLKDPSDAKKHRFKVGELVEIDHGVRVFVALQTRDCDGTPLYCLTPKKDDYAQITKGFANYHWLNGWPEDSMKRVKCIKELKQNAIRAFK